MNTLTFQMSLAPEGWAERIEAAIKNLECTSGNQFHHTHGGSRKNLTDKTVYDRAKYLKQRLKLVSRYFWLSNGLPVNPASGGISIGGTMEVDPVTYKVPVSYKVVVALPNQPTFSIEQLQSQLAAVLTQ